MNRYALDSSAVIALMLREPGAEAVAAILRGAAMSTVNIAEVAAKLVEWDVDPIELTTLLVLGRVTQVDFTRTQALLSGKLRRSTNSLGLSLGDRACLALAQERNLTAVTADKAWVGATAVQVLLIR